MNMQLNQNLFVHNHTWTCNHGSKTVYDVLTKYIWTNWQKRKLKTLKKPNLDLVFCHEKQQNNQCRKSPRREWPGILEGEGGAAIVSWNIVVSIHCHKIFRLEFGNLWWCQTVQYSINSSGIALRSAQPMIRDPIIPKGFVTHTLLKLKRQDMPRKMKTTININSTWYGNGCRLVSKSVMEEGAFFPFLL